MSPSAAEEPLQRIEDLKLEDYMARLNETESLSGLRKLHADLAGCSLDARVCSHLAFQHLIKVGVVAQDLIHFMDDARLNIAEAQNLMAFVSHATTCAVLPGQLQWITKTFHAYFADGLVGLEDMRALLGNLYKLVSMTYGTVYNNHHYFILQSLWTKFRSSSQFQSIGSADIWVQLLDQVQYLSRTHKSIYLAFDILAAAKPLHALGLTRLTQRLIAFCADLLPSFRPDGLRTTNENGILPHLAPLLNSLPQNFAIYCIRLTTKRLAAQVSKNQRHKDKSRSLIATWLVSISSCHHVEKSWSDPIWRQTYCLLSQVITPAQLMSHLSTRSPEEKCGILLRYWSGIDFGTLGGLDVSKLVNQDYPYRSMRATNIIDGAAGSFKDRSRHGAVVNKILPSDIERSTAPVDVWSGVLHETARTYIALIVVLARSRLHYETCLRYILNDLIAERSKHSMEAFVEIVMSLSLDHGIEVPAEPLMKFIELTAQAEPQTALRLFNLQRRPYLMECPTLVSSLIREPSIRVGDTMALLEAYDPAAALPVHRRTIDIRCALAPSRIDMIHDTADLIAKSDHLSARDAFKHVFRCYQMLNDAGAPLDSRLSRAMVLTAVVRPMQSKQKVSNTLFRIVLGVVRRVEGEEIARQLDEMAWTHRDSFAKDENGVQKRKLRVRRVDSSRAHPSARISIREASAKRRR